MTDNRPDPSRLRRLGELGMCQLIPLDGTLCFLQSRPKNSGDPCQYQCHYEYAEDHPCLFRLMSH